MARRKIDTQTEVKIVARMARGDTYQDIKDDLAKEGVDISLSGLTDVKQRNSMALEHIKSSLIKHETTKSARILDKAKRQLEQKLDAADNFESNMAVLKNKHESGELNDKEYELMMDVLKMDTRISMKDLVTVSKEMFNQSQIESGKPTSITESPEENKKNLMILLKAINDKDEIGMLKSIFPDA